MNKKETTINYKKIIMSKLNINGHCYEVKRIDIERCSQTKMVFPNRKKATDYFNKIIEAEESKIYFQF